MIVVGLTGSIGMGKTGAARMLRRLGVPVYDSDSVVHRLLGPGGKAVQRVGALFPETLAGTRIDRKRLGDIVFADPVSLRRLEAVLHPMVRETSRAFLAWVERRRARVAVLDIPLLFETGRDSSVDTIIVVSAPPFVQRKRVLGRPGMTEAKFRSILARQVPDIEKRRRATYVVLTGGHLGATYRQLRRIVRKLRERG